ncbi:MAG TPA: hypothetical protein VNC39_01720 [Acidocella sp.]|jgi:hypothetical protein|uniref:hypothetical protein n=1 Tax=Acidocella sp. TaxID=50710 RepID=UPI002BA82744|nr:hypothetical protein [Acidocella sp.]HVE20669.1 hypothetical protein [Acidocella sp.]
MTKGLPHVDVPPEMIPRDLAEALVAIGRLQVICKNQETKLTEHDAEVSKLNSVIQTANGVKIALFWVAAAILGATTIWFNVVNGKPWK